MDCKTCKEIRKQQEATISRYAFESTMVSFETTIKRLWIVIIILIALLAGTNGAWIYYTSQWEVVETTEVTQQADGSGNNSYIGGSYYGTSDGDEDAETDA